MRLRVAVLWAAVALAACSHTKDWEELQPPPPPPVRTDHLVSVDLQGSALRFGVDPASVSIGSDGIVRYVVVGTSPSGTVNAMYEGIRCSTAEVKVYARHEAGGWRSVPNADWKPLAENPAHRHSHAIARNAACVGRGPSRSADQFVRDLTVGTQAGERRFSN